MAAAAVGDGDGEALCSLTCEFVVWLVLEDVPPHAHKLRADKLHAAITTT
jgi:hypothetical protein